MISRVDLMTRCRPNFLYQIISAGRTDGHGGPHAARGPRVGRACLSGLHDTHSLKVLKRYRLRL